MKSKKIKQKNKKYKYYSIVAVGNKFLYGAFPFSKHGLSNAKAYLKKIDPSEKNFKIIKN